MAFNRLHLNYASGIYSYIADTIDDLQKLPRWSALGSSCYIINESALYIKNGNNVWVKQQNTESSGAGNSSSAIGNFENKIVNSLPSIGQTGVLYLVPNSSGEDNNTYNEFIYINNKWEQLGTIDSELEPIDINSIDNYFDQ